MRHMVVDSLIFLIGSFVQNGSHTSRVSSALHFSTTVRIFSNVSLPAGLNIFPIDMPVCDGIEACKRIRLLEGKRKVPVTLPSK